MTEYRKVAEFCYKNNFYNMYLDNKNRHYFLKKYNDELSYVTIEELIELTIFFNDIPNIMRIEKDNNQKKIRIVPKVLVGGVAVTLTLSLSSLAISMYQSQMRTKDFGKTYVSEQSSENYLSYNEENDDKQEQELVVDTYLESDWLKYLYIYDMDYLDKAFGEEKVSIDQVKEVINNNGKIPTQYKTLLYEYCDALDERYPGIELRVLYENLKTLEVVECSKEDLIKNTLSVDAYGCYVRNENKIYVLDDNKYEYGTWPYQVIFHEFSHCLRTGTYNMGDKKVKVQVEGQNWWNTITAESLNSLFTVSLFNYNEKDIAYQLQSNYHSVMIECMDNYSIEDYVQHSVSYYAKKLDEFNNDDNYATTILELIELQYKDYHSDSIHVEQSEYYPIYDYISNMYYRKNITPDMSYSEALGVSNQLKERVLFDVPEDYNIDTNRFDVALNNYCESIGINTNVKNR